MHPHSGPPEDGEALVRQLINGQVAEPWLRHGCETTGACARTTSVSRPSYGCTIGAIGRKDDRERKQSLVVQQVAEN